MTFRNPVTSLRADQITGGQLGDDVIAAALADGVVTGPKIAASAITAGKIAAGAITAAKIAADAIDGKTITGATLRTAAAGNRVVVTQAGPSGSVAFYAGIAGETPGQLFAETSSGVAGNQVTHLIGGTNPVTLPASGPPRLTLGTNQGPDSNWRSQAQLRADEVYVAGETMIAGRTTTRLTSVFSNATLGNLYANYGSATLYPSCGARRTGDKVELQGLLKNAVALSMSAFTEYTIGQVPYDTVRHENGMFYPVVSSAGPGFLRVNWDGQLMFCPFSAFSQIPAGQWWLSLAGIVYEAPL